MQHKMMVIGINCSGEIDMRLNLRNYHFGPGQVVVIPEGAIVDRVSHQGQLHFAFIAINNQGNDYLSGIRNISNLPTVFSPQPLAFNSILDTYGLLRRVIEHKGERCDELLKIYIQSIALWLAQSDVHTSTIVASSKLSRKEIMFDEFMQNLQVHFMRERSVAFYANLACVTPKYFGIIIKEVSGRRPIDWIDDMVILYAKAALLSGEHSVKQIAEILHFATPSYFGRYFKEHVGCTPGQFGK